MNREVVFFIDSMTVGGAERVISVLSRELSEKQYNVSIVMLRKEPIVYPLSDDVKVYFAEDMPVDHVYGKVIKKAFSVYNYIRRRFYIPFLRRIGVKDYPKWNETKFYFYANYAMPYREFLKKREGCTAFGFLVRSNIVLVLASKGLKIKTVFCERNNPVRPDIPKNLIKIRDELYPGFSAGAFQTPDEMAYYTRLKGEKVVIPNPLKENLPERYMGDRRHEIVNFCRLSKQKNLPMMIDAFAMLREEYPDYTLKIYGVGEEEDNIKQYIKSKNLEQCAFVEDFASDVHERIVDAAMFVSTSNFEGLSNSMIEAMAIGLPCICTDCAGGGAKMMIKDHENGLLVPMKNVQTLYENMKELLSDADLADKISLNAIKIREQLSVEKIAEQWEKMI